MKVYRNFKRGIKASASSLSDERIIAENLYNASIDMDFRDYEETAEDEISLLELALSKIKGDSNEEMQTLYNCLDMLYGG